jgi:hypothetical protein
VTKALRARAAELDAEADTAEAVAANEPRVRFTTPPHLQRWLAGEFRQVADMVGSPVDSDRGRRALGDVR